MSDEDRPTQRAARSRGGVVTFMFTDLVGSTGTAARLGEDAAEELGQMHFALLRKVVGEHAGDEVKNIGDGLMVAFTSPVDAAEAALAIQLAVVEHNAAHLGRTLSVRIGLHAGEPIREDGDYFGTPVVVAARLCAAAEGGQILAGEVVAALVGSRDGFRFRSVGPMALEGLTEPLPAVALDWAPDSGAPALAARRAEPVRPRRSAPRGPELVGRGDELAALNHKYEQAAAGQFHCVLVVGDPGVGKTRLAAELLTRHAGHATVLRSRAHPMAAGASFGVWAEALDPLLQVLGDDEVAELCGGFLDDLAGLFHRVAALRGPWSAGPAQEAPRPRLLAGLTRIFDELSARGPVIALLDDAHWADASSWEVLRQLARRLDDAPLLVVLTARQIELNEHETAAEVLFELEQDGLLTRLDLAPLDRAGLRQLAEQIVGASPPAALLEWVSDRSRGNPLFALGLLRALVEEGADLAAPALKRLPESLAERVAVRARTLQPQERVLLELVAVLGRPVHLGELVALSGRSIEALTAPLAQMVATRGVIETERGHSLTYEFSHPLIRDVVYDQISGARRRVLHRQVARMLRDAGHAAEAALHFARCAETGDAEAVAALLEALAQAEAREAVREALTLLASLVELLPATDPRWLEVLDALQDRAEWVSDHRAETNPTVAVAALRAIDGQLTESVDPARRALVKFRLAHFLAWGTGEAAEAEVFCRQARELSAAAGDAQQVRVADRELAWIIGCQGDVNRMGADASVLVEEARTAADSWAEMLSLAAVAMCTTVCARFNEASSANDQVIALALAQNKPYRATVATNMSAAALAAQGRMSEARALMSEAKRRDPAYRETVHLDLDAIIGVFGGEFPAALEAARESAVASPGARLRRVIGMLFGALAATEMGEPEEAAHHLDRARALLQGRNWQYYLPLSQHAGGLLSWSRGELDAGRSELRLGGTGMREMGISLFGAPILLDLTECSAEVGDAAGAAAAAAELAAVAGPVERDRFDAMAALGRAWAALAAGDPSVGETAARAALKHLAPIECPILLARAQYVLGRALAPTAPAEAAAALDEAARLFSECGATWRRGLVLAAMRRTGNSGRRVLAAARGPDSLTRREREVARLAAQGRSGKEIAEGLFVGERTVESHLGNVYAKLGVESKLDLMRRATELGLN